MANDDVLSSILAELRDLKASHSNLESRLESLAISIPGTFSPVLGGAHYGGGGGGRRGSAAGTPASNGSIPIKSTIDIGQPVVQPTGPIAPIQFGSSPPIDSNHHQSNTTTTTPHARKGSIDHAAKQEFINYIRNTPPLQPKDAASSTSGSAAQQVLERNIYPSRAVLTSELTSCGDYLLYEGEGHARKGQDEGTRAAGRRTVREVSSHREPSTV